MRFAFVFIFSTLSFAVFAQPSDKELAKHAEKVAKSRDKGKNICSLDTLFASGKPYCIMQGSKKLLGGFGAYSIRPLAAPAQEEIYMEMQAEGSGASTLWYWNMVFVNHGRKIRFRNGTMDIENTLVEYNLLNETGINLAGMNKLLLLKGDQNSTQPIPAQDNRPVERNRSGMIQISGNSILQSGVLIGSISKEVKAGGGLVLTLYTVRLPNGELVATAKNNGATDHQWQLMTAKDNKSHNVSSSIGQDENDLLKYLVDQLYL